jgi:hypothetical protein
MNNTDEIRKNIDRYGIGRINLYQESTCSSAPTNYAFTYITYSRIFNLNSRLIKPFRNAEHIKKVSMLALVNEYSDFGDHIPIPCHDFILKSVVNSKQFFYLITRNYWPMSRAWWPVGGRRILPCLYESFIEEWCIWDEVYWKLQEDLELSFDSVIGIQEIARSDHYHLCFCNAKLDQIIRRRVTPVTTYLVEIRNEAMKQICKPKTEASIGRWFSEFELNEYLGKLEKVMIYPDHLRVIFSAILRKVFPLSIPQIQNIERPAA